MNLWQWILSNKKPDRTAKSTEMNAARDAGSVWIVEQYGEGDDWEDKKTGLKRWVKQTEKGEYDDEHSDRESLRATSFPDSTLR